MPNDFKVFHELQIAHSALFRAADKRTKAEINLSLTQLAVLFVLNSKDGQPISEIAKSLAMGKSSLTGLVDRMCDKGLVKRIDSSADGRVTNIFMQDKGQQALAHSKQKTQQINRALLEPFDAEEQQIIRRFLDHITERSDEIINGTSEMKENG